MEEVKLVNKMQGVPLLQRIEMLDRRAYEMKVDLNKFEQYKIIEDFVEALEMQLDAIEKQKPTCINCSQYEEVLDNQGICWAERCKKYDKLLSEAKVICEWEFEKLNNSIPKQLELTLQKSGEL